MIHADLFPDNVLMLGNRVSGLIDFYFACTDIDGLRPRGDPCRLVFRRRRQRSARAIGEALSPATTRAGRCLREAWAALPVLARGAAMRFLASRAYDWLHTPADALVTRKDPMVFARRLAFYADRRRKGLSRAPPPEAWAAA